MVENLNEDFVNLDLNSIEEIYLILHFNATLIVIDMIYTISIV